MATTPPNPAPLRLRLSRDALVANWRFMAAQSGTAACGAAVKANGYGLGAPDVVSILAKAGCRDFFVATWDEAMQLASTAPPGSMAVLHGLRHGDIAAAAQIDARPVLNTMGQVKLWRDAGQGRACDIMVDTGMNRLGISPGDVGSVASAGLNIDTVMTHLASADDDGPQNEAQRALFAAVRRNLPARRHSIANSAGILLGSDYHADLTRPGLALYGGVPRAQAAGYITPVATPEAQILQVRRVQAGEHVGYNATWTAQRDTDVATVNLGYADGYFRAFSNAGHALMGDKHLPVIGRVSMDLVTLALSPHSQITEGDWVAFPYDLPEMSKLSGLSQYELLTSFGQRFERFWV